MKKDVYPNTLILLLYVLWLFYLFRHYCYMLKNLRIKEWNTIFSMSLCFVLGVLLFVFAVQGFFFIAFQFAFYFLSLKKVDS
jgi:predicted ferric reductase